MNSKITWQSDTEFMLEGVKFKLILEDYYKYQTTTDEVVFLKSRAALELYQGVLEGLNPANVLEFGVFQGGSPVFFSLFYGLEKFVGIDISQPIPGLDEFLRSHPVGERIKLYYEVSQDNEAVIQSIVADEFGDRPIDLIIDDASHQYELTKRSFEIGFPLLRPGGIYAIEDWGWAHWEGFNDWEDAPALSNLIFELVMSCATSWDKISEVRIFPAFAYISKSEYAVDRASFRVEELYQARGNRLNII
jgi:cephalosporin hydroxylase